MNGLGFNIVPERSSVDEKGVVSSLIDVVKTPRNVIKGKVTIGAKTGQLR